MAQSDPSIYSNIRQFTMPDQLETTARAMQIADAQHKFTLEDDVSGALAETGGDLSKASQLLAQRGRGTAAISLGDKAAAQAKSQTEQKLKVMEAAASDGIALDAAWRQTLDKNGGNREAALQQIAPIYAEVRQRWAGLGHQMPDAFNPEKNLAGIGQAKEAAQYLKGLRPTQSDLGKLLAERDALPQNDPRRASYDATINEKSNPTELARLYKERDAMPEGDPRRATYDRVLTHYKAGKGDTNVTVNSGPMTPGKQAGNKIDEDLLGMTRNLMQLDTIAGQFKPEYQRFGDKAYFTALKAKDASPLGLTNKERQDLTQFSQYRRNAFNTLNEYIKSVTGAAMSEAEADRIRKSMPDPGDGIFGGDSPTEFKSKLDDAIAQTKKAVARLSYLKRNGMSLEDGLGKGVTLEKMPELMNQRGRELEAKFKQEQPEAGDKVIQKSVRRQLSIEFGLSND